MEIVGEWFKQEGVGEEALSNLIESLDFSPPKEYIALLKYSNGGEGPLDIQPFNFVLYDASEILEYEIDESVDIPGYFVFGGNGGGEFLAINKSDFSIVSIDACNTNFDESIEKIANNFEEFLHHVGKEENA